MPFQQYLDVDWASHYIKEMLVKQCDVSVFVW